MPIPKKAKVSKCPNAQMDISDVAVDLFDREHLSFTEEQLAKMTENHSAPVIECIPGFRYWEVDERRRMGKDDNICGHQQRAYEYYWAIRSVITVGGIGLSIGSGAVGTPGTLTTDRCNGVTPDAVHYNDDNYGFSAMHVDSDEKLPFFDDQFNFVVSNHSIEHMIDPAFTVREMLRVTKLWGYVCFVTPDMAFMARGQVDPTHTVEFSGRQFWDMIVDTMRHDEAKLFRVIELNTFDNGFSLNCTLQRCPESHAHTGNRGQLSQIETRLPLP